MLSRTYCALAFSLLATSSWAQTTAPDNANHAEQLQQRAAAREQARAEIASTRNGIRVRLQEEETACWQRFAVESCLQQVRKAAREEEQPLRERELRLNNEERQEKAQERLRAIEQKKREKQVPSPVTATPRDGSGTLSLDASRQSQAQQRAASQAQRVQKHEADVSARQAQQEEERIRKAQDLQAKQAEAEARRAAKAQDLKHSRGAPLPIPEIPPKP